jgi:hypothetical protein
MKPAQIIFVTVHSKNIYNIFHLIFLDLMFFHELWLHLYDPSL